MSIAMPIDESMPADDASAPDPSAAPGVTITPEGRLRQEGLSDTDRNMAIAVHLSPFSAVIGLGPFALLAPLVLWLVRKDKSAFVDDHGREAVNYLLTSILFMILFIWTIVVPMVLFVLVCINLIRASVAAGNGEYFRYPMTIRFLG